MCLFQNNLSVYFNCSITLRLRQPFLFFLSDSQPFILDLSSSTCRITWTTCVSLTNSWNVVHTYKVQFSNDSLVWKPSMNGTKEAVSEFSPTFCSLVHFPSVTFQSCSDIWTSDVAHGLCYNCGKSQWLNYTVIIFHFHIFLLKRLQLMNETQKVIKYTFYNSGAEIKCVEYP